MDGMDGSTEGVPAMGATTRQQLTLREQITKVGLLRRRVTVFGDAVKRIRDRFEAEHAPEFEMLGELKSELGAEEQRLRQLTIEAFQETGAAKPAPGVSIRQVTEVVYDEAQALAWAREHNVALQLDRKAFEKIAAATTLDFVVQRKVPQATLAKELPVELGDGTAEDVAPAEQPERLSEEVAS